MLCQTQLSRDCPTSERCYLEGCQQPYGPPPGTALARERQPIDLPPLPDHQPGLLMRTVMRMQEAGERLVQRGPTPFAPDIDTEAILAAVAAPQESPPMSETAPPPPVPNTSGRAVSEIRIRRVGSGWLLYANGQEVDIATDSTIGNLVGQMASR